jgi:hypothetical protein
MIRSTVAVIVGYVVFAMSAAILFKVTHQDPHASASIQFVVVSTVYGMLFAALAGFIAVRTSSTHSIAHAIAVAVLIAAAAVASLVGAPGAGARWSQLSALLLMSPAAVAGGALSMWVANHGT